VGHTFLPLKLVAHCLQQAYAIVSGVVFNQSVRFFYNTGKVPVIAFQYCMPVLLNRKEQAEWEQSKAR
jgi:hypothetical protein